MVKTGVGAGGTNTSFSSTVANEYNTEIGAHASTTGNIYGIYDMSGGAWEYVASYDKEESVTSHGSDLVNEAKNDAGEYISTKYATAYEHSQSDSYNDVYEVSKTGDAIKEVRTDATGWFGDYSGVCFSSNPFFIRGGGYDFEATAGVFCSNGLGGTIKNYRGFRASLCP